MSQYPAQCHLGHRGGSGGTSQFHREPQGWSGCWGEPLRTDGGRGLSLLLRNGCWEQGHCRRVSKDQVWCWGSSISHEHLPTYIHLKWPKDVTLSTGLILLVGLGVTGANTAWVQLRQVIRATRDMRGFILEGSLEEEHGGRRNGLNTSPEMKICKGGQPVSSSLCPSVFVEEWHMSQTNQHVWW